MNRRKIVKFRKKKQVSKVNESSRRTTIVIVCVTGIICFVVFEIIRGMILS